jgi:hypothetical protein
MENIKISDFLSKGCMIKTQVSDGMEWITNVVYNLYEDTEEIEIGYDDGYLNNLVMLGDAIKITYTQEAFEYIVETWITGIRIEPVKIMTVKVVSIKKVNNFRKDERYSVNYAATVQSFDEIEGVFGVVINISISGLAFVCRNNFMMGDTIRLSILLPASSFVIDAEIVRTNETPKGTEYGVRFLREDIGAKEEILKLIENIKEREDRLSRIVGFNTLR